LRIIAVPMMPMPTMPTRLAIPPPELLSPISKTAIARPRQQRFFLPPGAIRDLKGLTDPGYYADYLCQTKS
jgi:hypothetical protein